MISMLTITNTKFCGCSSLYEEEGKVTHIHERKCQFHALELERKQYEIRRWHKDNSVELSCHDCGEKIGYGYGIDPLATLFYCPKHRYIYE